MRYKALQAVVDLKVEEGEASIDLLVKDTEDGNNYQCSLRVKDESDLENPDYEIWRVETPVAQVLTGWCDLSLAKTHISGMSSRMT